MAFGQIFPVDGLQHRLRVAQQPQLVGDAALAFSQGLGSLFLGQPITLNQKPDPSGFFNETQILPLQIFNEGDHPALPVGHAHHQTGHFRKSCQLCGPQAAFSGDQLIASLNSAHRQGLQHPMPADTLGQLRQRIFGKDRAGLVGVGRNGGEGQKDHPSGLHISVQFLAMHRASSRVK